MEGQRKCKFCKRLVFTLYGEPICDVCALQIKHVSCLNCNVEYEINLSNPDYHEYGPTTAFCNECLKKSFCNECKNPDAEVTLMCNSCPPSERINSMSCLKCENLSEIPKGPWHCEHCRQAKNQGRRKRPKAIDDAEIGRNYRRWYQKMREMDEVKQALANLPRMEDPFTIRQSILDTAESDLHMKNNVEALIALARRLRQVYESKKLEDEMAALEKEVEMLQSKMNENL